MTKIIYRVSTWHELFNLPKFEKEPVHRELITKGDLVGDYEMSPGDGLRPCGILKCQTNHRHGYIVQMPDQRLSHVGRDCGKTHFGESWTKKRKAFAAARTEAAKLKALEELKELIRATINTWPAFDTPSHQAARRALMQFDLLPEKLRSTLENRAQSGDVTIPGWRDPTPDEIRQAKFYGRKAPVRVQFEQGPLRGLRGINRKSRIDHLIDCQRPLLIEEAENLISKAHVKSDELQTFLRRLVAFPGNVGASASELQAFLSDANLKRVTLLLAAKDLGIEDLRYDDEEPAGFIIQYKGRHLDE
jgi:hypothetical protein